MRSAGAALALMIVDPKAVSGASFQLTFLSVLIIGGVGISLLERTSGPYKLGLRHLDSTDYDVTLPPKGSAVSSGSADDS